MKHGVCKYCGKEFTRKTNHGNDAMMFCSRECSYAYHSQKKKERFKREMESKKIEKVCPVCGNSFVTNLSQKIYCSKECSYKHLKSVCNERNKINYRKNYVSKKIICKNCGIEFNTYCGSREKFCSNECAHKYEKRMSRNKTKSRLKGKIIDDNITLEKIIKRDKGICKLCNKPVDIKDCYIDKDGAFIAGDMYPSIDHIKPLSKNGLHSWDNIQLAHRKCNWEKSDTYDP